MHRGGVWTWVGIDSPETATDASYLNAFLFYFEFSQLYVRLDYFRVKASSYTKSERQVKGQSHKVNQRFSHAKLGEDYLPVKVHTPSFPFNGLEDLVQM